MYNLTHFSHIMTILDEETILSAIHEVVLSELGVDYKDHTDEEFNDIIQKASGFNWKRVAEIAKIPKQKVKRWYDETYQRRLHGPVSKDDVAIIRQIIYKYDKYTF